DVRRLPLRPHERARRARGGAFALPPDQMGGRGGRARVPPALDDLPSVGDLRARRRLRLASGTVRAPPAGRAARRRRAPPARAGPGAARDGPAAPDRVMAHSFFSTSLRRDPGQPRDLAARIEAELRERIEEAVDLACLDALVKWRRARGLPAPAADSVRDRAE